MRALGIFFALVIGACRPADANSSAGEAAAPIRVQTIAVVEKPMPEYVTLTGSLRANQETEVAADAVGKVVQTLVERGQPVTKGQVLVTLDARGASLSANAAEAQAKVAQSQLEQARRECERVKNLLDTKAISQAEFDRQTADCTSKQWGAAAAEAQQQSASKLLGDSRVRAPFDGIVGERFVNVGQYVTFATRVASIYQGDPLRLQLTVPEANVAVVQPDMIVSFTVAAFGEEHFQGAVKFISPNVREATRDLLVEAIVLNPGARLKPGMFAVAKVTLGDRPRTVLPPAAVVRDETSARVFVVASGQIQERIVQIGEVTPDTIVIQSGVRTGDNVVLSPGTDVHDGAKVQ